MPTCSKCHSTNVRLTYQQATPRRAEYHVATCKKCEYMWDEPVTRGGVPRPSGNFALVGVASPAPTRPAGASAAEWYGKVDAREAEILADGTTPPATARQKAVRDVARAEPDLHKRFIQASNAGRQL